jgi:hypothetical protein
MRKPHFLASSNVVGRTDWPAFRSGFRPISGEIEEFRKPSCGLSYKQEWTIAANLIPVCLSQPDETGSAGGESAGQSLTNPVIHRTQKHSLGPGCFRIAACGKQNSDEG